VQLVQGPLLSLHSKVLPASDDWKAKVALVSFVLAGGPERIVVCGAVVSASTVQDCFAGLESVLPAASTPRTRTVCAPWLTV
jgi:hypothetical protein